MFSAIRRRTAARASDSCCATGACSGGSTALLPCDPNPLHLIEDGVGHAFLPRPWHPLLGPIDGDDRHLVLRGIEPDARDSDVIDHNRVKSLALELASPIGDCPLAVLGGKAD